MIESLSQFMPSWLAMIVRAVVAGTLLVVVAVLNMLFITWMERKTIGRIQDRIGANRAGPFGLLQPLADMVKIMTKEDITPTAAHRWIYNLGPILVVPPALAVFAVLPFGAGLVGSDLNIGVLYIIAVASTTTIGILVAGWGSNNKYALLGSMRAVAQMVSYEVPQALSLIGIIMLAGSLSLQDIIARQSQLGWFILLQPLGFVIFLISSMAEVNRTPFDLPEAESEIIAGHHTEYSGLKFGMFYLAEYINVFFISALTATLFFGGYTLPFIAPDSAIHTAIGPFVLLGKTYIFVFMTMWIRGTLPRVRVDHLMAFAWKALVPLSLLNIFVVGALSPWVQLWLNNSPGWAGVMAVPVFLIANAAMFGVVFYIINGIVRRNRASLEEGAVAVR